jgi:hypothetical protein
MLIGKEKLRERIFKLAVASVSKSELCETRTVDLWPSSVVRNSSCISALQLLNSAYIFALSSVFLPCIFHVLHLLCTHFVSCLVLSRHVPSQIKKRVYNTFRSRFMRRERKHWNKRFYIILSPLCFCVKKMPLFRGGFIMDFAWNSYDLRNVSTELGVCLTLQSTVVCVCTTCFSVQ